MAGFDVVQQSDLDAAEAWRRVTDWERHGEFAPLTKVRVDRDPATGCERFVARSGLGAVGFDDVMLVTYAKPPTDTEPGIARIVKTGRVVCGWAVLTVAPTASGCEIRWHEEARLRGTGGPLVWLVNVVVAGGFRRLLAGLLADTPAG